MHSYCRKNLNNNKSQKKQQFLCCAEIISKMSSYPDFSSGNIYLKRKDHIAHNILYPIFPSIIDYKNYVSLMFLIT